MRALAFALVTLASLVVTAAPARAEERDEDGWDRSASWRDHGFGGPTVRASGAMPLLLPQSNLIVGLGAGFRIHGAPALALELAYDVMDGSAPNGARRRDSALGFYAFFYPRPGGRTQAYVMTGIGHAWQSPIDGEGARTKHAAAWLGSGFEWFISRSYALSWDVRAFLRANGDATSLPWAPSPIGGTNMGLLFTLGGQLYVFGK